MKCRINIDNEKFKKINNIIINKNRLYKAINISKFISKSNYFSNNSTAFKNINKSIDYNNSKLIYLKSHILEKIVPIIKAIHLQLIIKIHF